MRELGELLQTPTVRHCGLVESMCACKGTGFRFDSWSYVSYLMFTCQGLCSAFSGYSWYNVMSWTAWNNLLYIICFLLSVVYNLLYIIYCILSDHSHLLLRVPGMHCRVICRPSQLFLFLEELSNIIYSCLLTLTVVQNLVWSNQLNVSRFVIQCQLLPSHSPQIPCRPSKCVPSERLRLVNLLLYFFIWCV